MQPPQSYSVRGQPSSGQLTGKPAGTQPDYLVPVDGLEKTSLANSDVVIPGLQTPPLKGRGKLSSLGNIFKPWKWRKKKTSEKFQETSAAFALPLIQIRVLELAHIPLALNRTLGPITGETWNKQRQADADNSIFKLGSYVK
ncbi:UNVERIFIED_CONTAM: hypothetical protein FKN15_064380 [Acipenser sinensis]